MMTIFLGAPGTGKGTASEVLIEKYGWKHISTGDAFRAIMNSGSELGQRVTGLIEGGNLVDDETTGQIVEEYLAKFDMENDKIILDGYPRTLVQVDHVNKLVSEGKVKMDKVVFFDLDSETQLARLTGRQGCPQCKAGYHKLFKAPTTEGVCDECGTTLTQREDDKIENVKVRLEVYEELTAPVADYYEKEGNMVKVDASVHYEELAATINDLF